MYRIPPTIKNIILIRHGQSQEQSGESEDGKNPPLSNQGILQSQKLSHRLRGYTFDIAYVSPLKRAVDTFKLANIAVNDVYYDSRIIENDEIPGWYEDLISQATDDGDPLHNSDSWLLPCHERAERFACELKSVAAEQILVFSHQGFTKYLIATWLGIDPSRLYKNLILDNVSLTGITLDAEGGCWVNYVNDSHGTFDESRNQVYRRPVLPGVSQ